MDRKAREVGFAANHVRGVMAGEPSASTVAGNHAECVAQWIITIRNKFQGAVLRRTGSSKTYSGEPISGLSPIMEHNIMFPLYPHEAVWMEQIASQLSSEKAEAGMTETGGKVTHSALRMT